MNLKVNLAGAIIIFLSSAATAQLAPGPVTEPAGAKFGEPIIFENEITGYYCYPLIAQNGVVLIWISELHRVDERTIVRRCVEYDPAFSTPQRRHGYSQTQWEELHFTETALFPLTEKVEIPDYQYFSNPSFCDSKVAYWTQAGISWSVRIYDFEIGKIVVTEFVRENNVATDNPGHFERPTWNDTCSSVTVNDHSPIGED